MSVIANAPFTFHIHCCECCF